MANSYRIRRRGGPAGRISELQKIDLLTGVMGGRSFPTEAEAIEAWRLLRLELIDACLPGALPWGFWRFESSPDDCTDNHVEAGEDVLEAFDRVTRARTEWAQAVHAAMSARHTTKEA